MINGIFPVFDIWGHTQIFVQVIHCISYAMAQLIFKIKLIKASYKQ